ncbi:MAG TPA: FAD-binding protein, partial [Candidatus Polarisedimenticolia bacterium]|nr:FAD-binding protein [Candidatus Polarisedimenticolia bacterium]
MPGFPYTRESAVARWSNFHGTIRDRAIPQLLVPDMPGEIDPGAPPKLRRCGEAISAIVAHAIQEGKTLRVSGSRWSLSNVIEPGEILLDSAYMNEILKVRTAWLTTDYMEARSAQGFVPIFAQGGATIHSLNKALGDMGLALRTSGAADGQRIAGAVATGTHGSAFDFGAMHDAILGMHLVVAGDRALFVMPGTSPAMTADVGDWLAEATGIPTETLRDDDLFAATLVSLGSLGVVHGVVLEAEPLYGLRRQVIPIDFRDAGLRQAIETLDTVPLHPHRPTRPFHFEVVLSPYPPAGGGAFVILMWKEDAALPPISPPPKDPDLSFDLFNLIGTLASVIRSPEGGQLLEDLVNTILSDRYNAQDDDPRFPGEVFGPTTVPPGSGTSTEIAVGHENTFATLSAIYAAIAAEAAEGRHHLGGFGVRFVPRGQSALLGMNQSGMTTHIEMAGIRTLNSMRTFSRCWRALDSARIPFACHWGQQGGHTPGRVQRYFGGNVTKWR